ncbi:MAG TPA: hypothetical protein DC049_16450 [Spirochaetia bacterium]|nr:hypothetical protein [Spirochaetia bacterium]
MDNQIAGLIDNKNFTVLGKMAEENPGIARHIFNTLVASKKNREIKSALAQKPDSSLVISIGKEALRILQSTLDFIIPEPVPVRGNRKKANDDFLSLLLKNIRIDHHSDDTILVSILCSYRTFEIYRDSVRIEYHKKAARRSFIIPRGSYILKLDGEEIKLQLD